MSQEGTGRRAPALIRGRSRGTACRALQHILHFSVIGLCEEDKHGRLRMARSSVGGGPPNAVRETAEVNFAKLHGLGNDFLIAGISGDTGRRKSLSRLAMETCDRRRGIGADGIVFFAPTVGDSEAEISALIFNADGSRAEMSGNGLRCLAAYLHWSGTHSSELLRIRTVSGVRRFVLLSRAGKVFTFESSMGYPVIEPRSIPSTLGDAGVPVLDFPLIVDSESLRVSLCSMGNPHCSTFWPELAQAPVDRIGPLLERHQAFPNRTNVEFIQVLDRNRIRVKFWERGVGRTLASGTGSSAAAVAAILNKVAESPLTVETDLGELSVRWKPPEELFLTGPAEVICSGDYPEDEIS